MGIRPSKSIRDADKVAWTRFSRSKPRRSFIKAMPHQDLQVFRMGTMKKDYDTVIHLTSEKPIILRDNSIESARQTCNKYLEKIILGNYYFIVRVFPHHVVRENKMIAGAGADRLQKGMRQSFGRPVDKAARLGVGTEVFTLHSYKQNTEHLKAALIRARKKLTGKYKVSIDAA
ncbi:MAG: 50S ribosomal protein L16 [Candidatus Micrarchaeota archaeon]|nr:50S ribosomal protein L16 [Candidatus Micrarchaeota archaeon]